MKTLEMYKHVHENGIATFKKKSDGEEVSFKNMIVTGVMVDYYAQQTNGQCIRLHEEWDLVKKPVDFITALKAFDMGKKIICVSEYSIHYYKPLGLVLVDEKSLGVRPREIIHGKWYIEE